MRVQYDQVDADAFGDGDDSGCWIAARHFGADRESFSLELIELVQIVPPSPITMPSGRYVFA
jgi:hypothetical protein